ncbi:MAG: hypothetical protein CMK41_01150 [Porticoccaceae bacterium]|nr:hypothetical protein [Porticoccaceae bacterium]
MKKFLLLVLSLAALSVIFILPNLEIQTVLTDSEEMNTLSSVDSNEISQSTIAEKTRYRKSAQLILEELIEVRDILESQSVDKWGDSEFKSALKNVSEGDELYRTGDYLESIEKYKNALDQLISLKSRGKEIVQQAISESNKDIEKLDSELLIPKVRSSVNLASLIEPDNEDIKLLKTRIENLPELFNQIMQSRQLIGSGNFYDAKNILTEASLIDPNRLQTKLRLNELQRLIKEENFTRFMSEGFNALNKNEFSLAREVFNEALITYPNRSDVREALVQLETRQTSFQISTKIAIAESEEKKENWQKALEIYESVLLQDSTLTDIQAKLINIRIRAQLDKNIQNFIYNPLTLSSESNYQSAKSLLLNAKRINNQGVKLKNQILKLSNIIEDSRKLFNINLLSDQKTEITIFKIGTIGLVEKYTMSLVPGKYIAQGRRSGFRDKRVEFVIEPSQTVKNITVICSEKI